LHFGHSTSRVRESCCRSVFFLGITPNNSILGEIPTSFRLVGAYQTMSEGWRRTAK
jgi:hypothetical protein